MIVRVLANTGIRVAELASLNVHNLIERDRADYPLINGKGARQRLVPLTPDLAKRLRRFGDAATLVVAGTVAPHP